MQSLRSKLIISLIRNRHLLKFKVKPEVVDETFSVSKFREDIDKSSARFKLPSSVYSETTSIEGMNAERIIPDHPAKDKVLLYLHGGGFVSGSCFTHRMHVAKFATGSQLKALVFDYKLAPEYPFPAALNDCVLAYSWLLTQGYKPENIITGGESAGATLTLSLLLALKEKNIKLPKAAFCISPVTDLRCTAASFTYNSKKDVAPMGSWSVWTRWYIADNDPVNPLLSPQFGNFEGIPPLYICVGTHEIHYDDCINIASVARQYGVNVTLRIWDKMIHAFPLLSPLFPEAEKAMHEICSFIKDHGSGK